MNTSKSLDAYHLHSCHSRQAWVKGMDKPFPCDCGLEQAIVEAVEGLIGEDDEIPYDEGSRFYFKVLARNELRAELRQAIKEWQ